MATFQKSMFLIVLIIEDLEEIVIFPAKGV